MTFQYSGIEAYCRSRFWDSNLTWHTDDPELTECFQNTVLVWVPCGILWVLAPLKTHYLIKSKARYIPWTWLNTVKTLILCVLIVVQLVELGFAVERGTRETLASSAYHTPAIRAVTFLLIGGFVQAERNRGVQTSGILWFFWLVLSLCGGVTYRTHLRAAFHEYGSMNEVVFVTYMIYYPLVVAEFLLSCFADAKPRYLDDYTPDDNPCPEFSSSFLSQITYQWFDRLAWQGYKHPLKEDDLWSLNRDDQSRCVVPRFDYYWEAQLRRKANMIPQSQAKFTAKTSSIDISKTNRWRRMNVSVMKAIWWTFWRPFVAGAFLKLISDCLVFVNPQLLNLLITFVASEEQESWKGYFYSVLLLLNATTQSLIQATYFRKMYILGMRVRTSLIAAIYRKALRLSPSARKESNTGDIVNHMSVDAQRFMDLLAYINMIWSSPLQISLALYFLWQMLGVSVLAGLAVMILLIPINGVIASQVKRLQTTQMKYKDQRVKVVNEILNGIRVLKLYAWELPFQAQVTAIREKEIKVLKVAAYLNAGSSFIWTCAPFMVALASFGTYVYISPDNILTAKKAFVSISLFNIIQLPISFLPILIALTVQASVSMKRVNKYLGSEELNPNNVQHDQFETSPLIIENGTFSWEMNEDPVLRSVNVSIDDGSLVAIIGPVGSGKSSLLSAFLGELEKPTGRVNTRGQIAYVSQQSWIQNSTLRSNVLFGKGFNAEKYYKVIHGCALHPDLEILPAGDKTEIGEKGINLSGGQKQRVSLARAVYASADIYLMDDPLSAVDANVGKHIFDRVIGPNGLLRSRTRVLVTNGWSFLPQMDKIIVLRDGEITETGTYDELLAKRGAFAEFLLNRLKEGEEEAESLSELQEMKETLRASLGDGEFHKRCSEDDVRRPSVRKRMISSSSLASQPTRTLKEEKDKQMTGEQLIETEKTETGAVSLSVYLYYAKHVGTVLAVVTFLLYVGAQFCNVGSNLWLVRWSQEPAVNGTSQDLYKRDVYLAVYTALGIGQALFTVFAFACLHLGVLRAGKVLHYMVLKNVLKCSLLFFERTPTGRILNRFSKDVDTLDVTMPQIFRAFMACFFSVLSALFVISFSTPIFIVVLVPLVILYYFIQRFYVMTTRQLKRLESVSRSPIYSHFGETLSGASSIRAFGMENYFVLENQAKVDQNQVFYYPSLIANRWLAVRLELFGNLIVFCAALLSVIRRGNMDAGLVGLSITYALNITTTLNYLVRMTSDVEANIVSVERVKEYSEIPIEAPWEIADRKPPRDWPSDGIIKFNSYSTRYREGLDLALKDIEFEINSEEKVGIVGRTGAGKSTLTLALFRIIEAASGSIEIDNIDIAHIGLHDLRSKLTIIPQDPVMYSGTLRSNLDPFGQYTDEDLWQSLEHSHLKHFVKGLSSGLDHEIYEGGENLSVGQRQLVCLTRALLRKKKILILDEATAAIDLETDDLIQRTIRTEFKDCTILTIAHRLSTILDSDRIVVLDKGSIAESGTPKELLQTRDSIFYGMAKDAGLVS